MTVEPDQIRAVVAAVLAEQQSQMKTVAEEVIAGVLVSFGLHGDETKDLRADFAHLRKWRLSVEQAESLTFKAILTTLATGFIALVWMGVKTFLGK